ncbi:HNH endonuclease [Arthrobacter agilis]|uniref:HNH endonuclease n=1 Tax=Arthrobacter agilis TaxID=37921 RepID=A0A2L0UGV0_9MICC|nr:HNH endonuclease signature motif containing protein [Arthrobacter agilis]AUZ88457.1 HNH endonuclease [Arthrobacter agilis]
MAVAPLEHPDTPLEFIRSELLAFGQDLAEHHLLLPKSDVVEALVTIEEISKIVDYLQIIAARAAQDHDVVGTGEQDASGSLIARAELSLSKVDGEGCGDIAGTPSADADQRDKKTRHPEFRTCADFLRARLGISRFEANRRLRLAAGVLPGVAASGCSTPAPMPILGTAANAGEVSGRAVSIVHDAVQRVRTVATPRQLESMERHLTLQAMESDEDLLRVLARRWQGVLDQDGQEPTEKVLRARQGVFLKGRRNGLHFLEIGATDEQFEHLVTAMNTATNPRGKSSAREAIGDPAGGIRTVRVAGESGWGDTGGGGAGGRNPGWSDAGGGSTGGDDSGSRDAGDDDRPTRPQSLLDGLVSACRIALSTDGLSASGGHRPQVMVTISYSDLVGEMERAGHAVFGQQISARSIRKLACDADIIPLVLGGKGQILDIGRAQRLFPPHLRRGLVARDKGCAFPDCSIPATWCEAHHIAPWATGGTTSISQGVLLCSRHHHVVHEGKWTVESKHGIPWFTPPTYVDPGRTPRRNRYWQVEEAVHEQLLDAEAAQSTACSNSA